MNLNNRYQFMGLIGKGRLGDVYRAADNFFRRDVALKMIRKESGSPEFLQYFTNRYAQQISMQSKLNNPSIIKVYDFTTLNGMPAWTMDLYQGASYSQYVGKQMPVEQAANLLIPVADALTYAHQYGVFHGNLKPSNILLNNDQQPVLTDFGLAQWLSENGHGYGQFEASAGIGSPEYLAPEQAQGGPVDGRTDVYSLGIIFYELITGRRPFSAMSPLETMTRQVSDQLPSPRYYVPNVSQQAEQFLYQATAKNPAQRISSMSEAAMILRSLSNPTATGAYYPPASYYNANAPVEDDDDDDESFKDKLKAATGTFKTNKNAKYIAIAIGLLLIAGIVILIVSGNNKKIAETNASSTQAAISVEETQSAVAAMIEEQRQQTQEAEQAIQQQTQEALDAQAAAAAAAAAAAVEPTQEMIVVQPPVDAIPTASTQAQGRFYSQSPADGTTLITGQAFTVTWTWGNTGTTNWDEDFKLVFTGGTNFSAGAITEKYTNSIIYPNGHGDYTLDCVAPMAPGTYTMYWHVVDSNGEKIPVTENMSISINVVGGELTPTPAPTDAVQIYIAPSETPSSYF
ncbi:MAG: protein kinase [Anaerolineaceae bacterium]|nr:protein kinase [Anaerolineaceae bacterium]